MWGRGGDANTKTAEGGRGLNLKDELYQGTSFEMEEDVTSLCETAQDAREAKPPSVSHVRVLKFSPSPFNSLRC